MRIEHKVDVPPPRFVLVHYHIFKNGGTTLESVLRREFGPAFATVHGPADGSLLDAACLTRYLRRHPKIGAVSSHHLRYPKPEVRGWVFFDCCFIRHPLDRLLSLYNHFRRTDSVDPVCMRARRQPLREFMKQMIDEFPHLVSDVQVTQLASGGAFTRPANQADLDRAARILSDMAVPGAVDLFDESLVSAEYFLRPAFPALRLHHRPENVTRPAAPPPSDENLAGLWGDDVHADLLRLNRFDLELHRRARGEVLGRFLLLPGREARLAEFRARNARELRAARQQPRIAVARRA